MTMNTFLRFKGLVYLGGVWLAFVLFSFALDLSLAGYLLNSRTATVLYNVAHSTIGPFVFVLAAYSAEGQAGGIAAAIWFAHIGFDRVLGYG